MKLEFGYSSGDIKLNIFSHAGLFYLKEEKNTLLKTDNIKIARSYIDGFEHGKSFGSNKWFNEYITLKQSIR